MEKTKWKRCRAKALHYRGEGCGMDLMSDVEEGLIEVGDDVFEVFDADGEAD